MLPILLMIDEITQEDERELLRRLFFTYAPKMKLLAQSILKNEADAEDALHDTFLLVIRYRKKFVQADEIEIKRLLVIYSRSVCFNRLRREKRTRARIVPDTAPDADDGLHPAADIPDTDADPTRLLLTKEQADVLRRAIACPLPRGRSSGCGIMPGTPTSRSAHCSASSPPRWAAPCAAALRKFRMKRRRILLNAENNRDFEARIRDAAQRSLDKEVAAFDALDPDATAVSAKTERRILRAIHTLRTPRTHRTRLRRIAACAAILLSLTVAALLCVEPIRAAVWNFFFEWYEDHVVVRVGADEDAPSVIEEVILPDLPQGWTATEIANNRGSVCYSYDGPQGEWLVYDQNPINPDALHFFDSEHSTVKAVVLKGGYTAQLFVFESGTSLLFWSNRYTFTVSLKGGDDDLLYQVADDLNQKAAALTKKSEFSDFFAKK